jgi:hypothetical protein
MNEMKCIIHILMMMKCRKVLNGGITITEVNVEGINLHAKDSGYLTSTTTTSAIPLRYLSWQISHILFILC